MNKVIKFIVMFILTLAIVLIGGQVKAASVGISASTSKVDIGDTIKVTVSFGGQKVSAAQFQLNYDSSKFEYVSNSVGSSNYGASTKTFGYASAEPDLSSVTFTFKAKTTGNSNFGISGAKVSTQTETKVVPTITKSSVAITAQEKPATTENNNSNQNNSSTNNSSTNNLTTNKENSSSGTKTSANKSSSTTKKTTSSIKETTTNKEVETENNIENVEQTNNLVNEISENTISEQELNTIDNNTIDVSTISVKRDINIWQIIAIVEFVIIILLGIAMYIVIRKK